MQKKKAISRFVETTAAFFILLFVYTAVSKLIRPVVFTTTLMKIPLVHFGADWLTYLIPVTELLIVGMLVLPKYRATGLLLSGMLMLLFTVFIALLVFTQTKLPCSCGGIINAMGWNTHLVFNMLSTGLAFIAWQKTFIASRFHSSFYSNKTGVAENLQKSRQIS